MSSSPRGSETGRLSPGPPPAAWGSQLQLGPHRRLGRGPRNPRLGRVTGPLQPDSVIQPEELRPCPACRFCGECLQPCLQVPSPLCPLCRLPFDPKKVDKATHVEKQLSSYKAPCRGCSKKVSTPGPSRPGAALHCREELAPLAPCLLSNPLLPRSLWALPPVLYPAAWALSCGFCGDTAALQHPQPGCSFSTPVCLAPWLRGLGPLTRQPAVSVLHTGIPHAHTSPPGTQLGNGV